jgi:hypothetical protein
MNAEFKQAVETLNPKYEALMGMDAVHLEDLPNSMPKQGVYLLSEGNRHFYAGRTNNLRARLRGHISDSHYAATLAFLIARRETGNVRPTYKRKGSRTDLLSNPAFKSAFDNARQRIKKMDIRYVEETDPVRQALLEIYVALASGAEHNSFENH